MKRKKCRRSKPPSLNHRPNKPIVAHLACERMLPNARDSRRFHSTKSGELLEEVRGGYEGDVARKRASKRFRSGASLSNPHLDHMASPCGHFYAKVSKISVSACRCVRACV